MLQHVNKVLVGKGAASAPVATSATIAAATAGEVLMFDQNKTLITTSAQATAASSVFFGLKTGKTITYTLKDGTVSTTPEIVYGNEIKKGSITNYKFSTYSAVVEDVLTIDLTSATLYAGQRYVIRLAYRDIFEHPGMFTHSYEIFATDATATTVAAQLAAKINKHKGRRCVAVATAGVLVLTAIPKDDNEGVNSINYYTRVNLDGSIFTTVGGLDYQQISGATIAKTAGTNGNGFWKTVRDRENAALGYRGITYRTSWPYCNIKPDLMVVEGTTYDTIIIENENEYLTPNNQYKEKTMLSTELYIPSGQYTGSEIKTNIEAFIAA